VNNTDDKNRTVRARNVSKDIHASPSKLAKRNDDSHRSDRSTVRTVSRTKASPEKPRSPEKRDRERSGTPQRSPEKSTLGRKFAANVIQPAFEQVQVQLRKSPAEVEALLRLEKTWRNLDKFDNDAPLHLIKATISLISRYASNKSPPKAHLCCAHDSDAEMSEFFLKDVLSGQSDAKERERLKESYRQKSPLAELLYTRWIEGLRERWPAI
jgi:serine/threonine-protein kinase 24/25/MST4